MFATTWFEPIYEPALAVALQGVTLRRGSHDYRLTGVPALIVVFGFLALIVLLVLRYFSSRRGERRARKGEAHAEAGQRAANTARAETEAQYQLLFDKNPCAMWVFDLETTQILEVNSAAVAQYGYSRDEFTRMKLADLRAPEDAARLAEMLSELRADAASFHLARHVTKQGGTIDVEVRGHPLGIDGRNLRLVVTTDVTARLAAERNEAATSRMLASLIEVAPLPMVVVDRAWVVTHWNRAAETLFGWSPAEVVGRQSPIVPPEDHGKARARQAQIDRGLGLRAIEVARLRKDGTRVDVLVAVSPIVGSNGEATAYVALYADLTERKALEEQLRQAHKMEAIGALAGGIAHDFNNILTVISSYSALLLSDDRYPETREEIQQIADATARAAALTRQLLTFSRKSAVSARPIDVAGIVAGMQSMLQRLLMGNIELLTKLGHCTGSVVVDQSQLEQIIMNLVINAADAMPDGGTLVVEAQDIELNEEYAHLHADVTPGPHVQLSVSDTGVGMDAATLQKVFEPFFTTKEAGRGTGLGLATVYGIVKQLGGHIRVYSQPGQGTTFKVYLPRVAAEASTEYSLPSLSGSSVALPRA